MSYGENKSANARQEGGTHYQTGALQHWDIAVMFKLDYFQGQITKYILRWRHKHKTLDQKLIDLRKARHFLDKYIEAVESQQISHEIAAEPTSRGYVNQD